MKYVTLTKQEIDAGLMDWIKNIKTALKEKKYGVLWEHLKKYYPKEYAKLKRERELGEAKINKKHKGSQKIWLEMLNKELNQKIAEFLLYQRNQQAVS